MRRIEAEHTFNELDKFEHPVTIILCGPSGAGKTTLTKALLADRQDCIRFSVSHTTRTPRPGEQDGTDYHFVSRDIFSGMREMREMFEYTEIHGNLYGTSWAERKRLLNERCVIMHLDCWSASIVKSKILNAVVVFVAPPSIEALRGRLEKRGDNSAEEIERRLADAIKCIKNARRFRHKFDFVVDTFDKNKAISEIKRIVDYATKRIEQRNDTLATLVRETNEALCLTS